MKLKIFVLFLIIFFAKINAQQQYPFFQQLAFDFYTQKIVNEFPRKERIRITKSLNDDCDGQLFYIPNCLKSCLTKVDSVEALDYYRYLYSDNSRRDELNLENIDPKQFKIKRNCNGNFPRLVVLYPKRYKERIFVNIHEKWEKRSVVYVVEFDIDGKIIDWCREEFFWQIEY